LRCCYIIYNSRTKIATENF